MDSTDEDPIVASYDVLLTDSEVSRYVFQYIDRPEKFPYTESKGQKPIVLRMKHNTGLVELEVPIFTRDTYDEKKGLRYGEAMRKSRSARDGGSFGMAGGFSSGGVVGPGRIKPESDVEIFDNKMAVDSASLVRTQPLGGRIKPPEEGDPVYMLGTFKGSTSIFFLSNYHGTGKSSCYGRPLVLTAAYRKPTPLASFCSGPITSQSSPPGCTG